jgi:hypothetical protein
MALVHIQILPKSHDFGYGRASLLEVTPMASNWMGQDHAFPPIRRANLDIDVTQRYPW